MVQYSSLLHFKLLFSVLLSISKRRIREDDLSKQKISFMKGHGGCIALVFYFFLQKSHTDVDFLPKQIMDCRLTLNFLCISHLKKAIKSLLSMRSS